MKGDPDILNATQACGSMVLFKTAVDDAGTLAPEISESVKKAEPVFSPRTVEDICQVGHPNGEVMQIRKEYFWFLDLLKNNPQARVIPFDLSALKALRPRWSGIPSDMFDDWELYGATPAMVEEGLRLLDEYYYRSMQGKYTPGSPVTNEQVETAYKVILNLGGLFGLLSTVRPFLSPVKRQFFYQAIEDERTGRKKPQRTEYITVGVDKNYPTRGGPGRIPVHVDAPKFVGARPVTFVNASVRWRPRDPERARFLKAKRAIGVILCGRSRIGAIDEPDPLTVSDMPRDFPSAYEFRQRAHLARLCSLHERKVSESRQIATKPKY